ncbi:MAG: Twin-arginine translocation protein TatC, partial [uncultured Solirubrobacteraceae bacterium]
GHRRPQHRSRGPAQPRRAPRRAAHAADRVRRGPDGRLRDLRVAERADPRHRQRPAREHGLQEGGQVARPVRADGGPPGAAEGDRAPARARVPRSRPPGRGPGRRPRVDPGRRQPARPRRRRPRPAGEETRDPGRGGALHPDDQAGRLRRAAARHAAAPLPDVRVRPARLLPAREAGGAAADGRRAVPLRGRRALRVLRGPAERRRLPAELQRRRVRHPVAGARLLQVRDHGADRDGPRVPGADRDPRGHPGGDRQRRAAAAHPPLRDHRDRRPRDAAPRPGPGDHDHDDGPAVSALRGKYPHRSDAGPPRRTSGGPRGGRGGGDDRRRPAGRPRRRRRL